MEPALYDMLEIITSHVYSAYHYCLRQGWYAAHRMMGEQSNEWMARGKLIESLVKKRGYRQVYLLGSVIDIVEDTSRGLRVVEIKASKGSLERGIHQAKFFLFLLHLTGVDDAIAEVSVPMSKIRQEIRPSDEVYREVEEYVRFFYNISQGPPPHIERVKKCHACSYKHLCWGS